MAGPVVEKPDGLCNARRRDVPGGGATPLPGFLRRLSRQGAAALVGCAVCAAALKIFTGVRECARGGAVDAPSGLFARVPSESFGDRRLSGTGVRVLGGLMNGLWSGADAVFVSRGELARELGLSVRTVQRAVRELVAAGYVRPELRATRGGRRHCLVLDFRLRGRRVPAASDDCPGGDNSVTQGCQIWRGGVSVVSCSPGPPLNRVETQLEIPLERPATPTGGGKAPSSPAETDPESVYRERVRSFVEFGCRGLSAERVRSIVLGRCACDGERRWAESELLELADRSRSGQRSAAAGGLGDEALGAQGLVDDCRRPGDAGRAGEVCLRLGLLAGLDLSATDATPDELRRWVDADRSLSRQRSAAAGCPGEEGARALERKGIEP